MSEIKLKLRERGARAVEISSVPCTAADVNDYDTIAVNRGLFGTIAPDTATVLLSAVDKVSYR